MASKKPRKPVRRKSPAAKGDLGSQGAVALLDGSGNVLYSRSDLELLARNTDAAVADRDLLEAIIEASPECMKVLSANATVLQINRAGLEMLDAISKDELPSPIVELVVPEHREAFGAMAGKVLAGHPAQLQF